MTDTISIHELLKALRAQYGDRVPSAYTVRTALIEGRIEGHRVARDWLINPDMNAAALALRLKKPDGSSKAA